MSTSMPVLPASMTALLMSFADVFPMSFPSSSTTAMPLSRRESSSSNALAALASSATVTTSLRKGRPASSIVSSSEPGGQRLAMNETRPDWETIPTHADVAEEGSVMGTRWL
eukprot:31505_1